MVRDFQKEFGLDKDRVKLEAGLKDFDITHAVIGKSKKLYDVTDSEGKVHKDFIDIVSFNVIFKSGEMKDKVGKFYAPNKPIISACKDMLALDGTKDKEGKFKEPFHINEVVEGGEKGKEYLAFA